MKTCITDDCNNTVSGRGLCPKCYQSAKRYVNQGRVTWEKLEEAGLSLPPYRGRNKGRVRALLEEKGLISENNEEAEMERLSNMIKHKWDEQPAQGNVQPFSSTPSETPNQFLSFSNAPDAKMTADEYEQKAAKVREAIVQTTFQPPIGLPPAVANPPACLTQGRIESEQEVVDQADYLRAQGYPGGEEALKADSAAAMDGLRQMAQAADRIVEADEVAKAATEDTAPPPTQADRPPAADEPNSNEPPPWIAEDPPEEPEDSEEPPPGW
jgi:hypothetical protein